jgi:hypothetical protein
MKQLVLLPLLLLATMGMTATVTGSSMSFKDAADACPGSLGTVTFTMSHARFSANPGMTENIGSPDANGILVATFKNPAKGTSAKVTADQKKGTVSANNMKLESRGRVACINPG